MLIYICTIDELKNKGLPLGKGLVGHHTNGQTSILGYENYELLGKIVEVVETEEHHRYFHPLSFAGSFASSLIPKWACVIIKD